MVFCEFTLLFKILICIFAYAIMLQTLKTVAIVLGIALIVFAIRKFIKKYDVYTLVRCIMALYWLVIAVIITLLPVLLFIWLIF